MQARFGHEIPVPVSGTDECLSRFKREHLGESILKSQEDGLKLFMNPILIDSMGGKKSTVF